jgi:tRNA(fMet)-specific endonuclease VapC
MHLFAQLVCLSIPDVAADRYASIKWETERQGTPLDENDLWMAATALALEAVLVTTDSDFQRVSGLRIEDWTQ